MIPHSYTKHIGSKNIIYYGATNATNFPADGSLIGLSIAYDISPATEIMVTFETDWQLLYPAGENAALWYWILLPKSNPAFSEYLYYTDIERLEWYTIATLGDDTDYDFYKTSVTLNDINYWLIRRVIKGSLADVYFTTTNSTPL